MDNDLRELMGAAREVLARPVRRAGMVAALLGRQALEMALAQYWQERGFPEIAQVSLRAQLLCLLEYLGDERMAEATGHTWWALSRACHHHAYELPPNPGEVEPLLETTEKVIRALSGFGKTGSDEESG